MITPAFELSQDHDSITLVLRVPYTRTSEFDVCVDGEEFKFYAKPYFLRLTLPGRIVQDGRERASFDIDKGLFTMRVPKENPGERFEGLQMLTSLLAPKGSRSAKPLVEDLGACGGSDAQGDEDEEEEEEEEDFDWQVEQEAYVESSEEELKKLQKYGFGNLRTGVFSRLQEELSDVIDLKEPENSTPAARRCHRLDAETSIFCADHYLCDLYEGEEMRQVHLNFKPWWSELKPASDGHSEAALSFTDEEKEQMRKFTNRSYPLDKATRHRVWLGLVDVVLAYVYDVRTTEGEHNVESAWTIRKISGTLSWLETYNSLHEVLVSFGRRVLCYPLYRHFSLITTALRDAAHIFQCGKACVLKCLLAVHKIFRQNEPAYILNDLYITDYCVWIQRVKSKHVMALALPLSNAKLDKDDLDLELTLLEKAAELVVEEEEEEAAAEAKEEGQKTEHNEGEDSSSSEEESEQDSGDDEPEREDSEGVSFLPQRGNGQPEASVEALALPLPQESQSGGGGEGGGRGERLIQELGERLEEELKIGEHQLQTRDSSRRRGTDRVEPRETDGSQLSAALLDPKAAMAKGDLLETRRSKNPLRIVDTEELDSDDD